MLLVSKTPTPLSEMVEPDIHHVIEPSPSGDSRPRILARWLLKFFLHMQAVFHISDRAFACISALCEMQNYFLRKCGRRSRF